MPIRRTRQRLYGPIGLLLFLATATWSHVHVLRPAVAVEPHPTQTQQAYAAAGINMDIPILMYHYFTDTEPVPDVYHVTQETFEQQMTVLVAYGYETVTLQDYLDYRNSLATPPAHAVILTLDDGHKSIYTYARPVLNAMGLQATVFLTTDFIPETDLGWAWMAWDPHVETLYNEGFAIEAHSVTHPRLTEVSEEQAWQEISGSRTAIENHLGSEVRFFSYPGGYYDAAIQALVQQAGYQAAVAAWPDGIAHTASSDIWALPRIEIHETHSVELDPAHPGTFFMRKIDPQFPIPEIAVDAVRVQLADGTPDSCFCPGETITFTLTATNHGDPVTTQIVLSLDDDGDHALTYHHDVTSEYLASGERKDVSFSLTLPDGVGLGQHEYAADFADAYGVLGFAHSGWQPAFVVAESCPRPEIAIGPASLHFGSQDVDSGATPSQTVTLRSEGTADLHLHSVALAGADVPAFVVVSDSGEDTLATGATRILQIAFDPDEPRAHSAALRIESDDGNEGMIEVTLSGTGTLTPDEVFAIYLPLIARSYP
jgi:peptidoglycan/xylan/chitin deacetylase (PgdA/CDA1 family)